MKKRRPTAPLSHQLCLEALYKTELHVMIKDLKQMKRNILIAAGK
jgi:hypothetical protein